MIIFYRDDEVKKPLFFEKEYFGIMAAAIPCEKVFLKRKWEIKKERIIQWIKEIYEKSGAYEFLLDDALCEYLEMEKCPVPDMMVQNWLEQVPSFHTLIFADDCHARAGKFLEEKVAYLANACVVCYEENRDLYEQWEQELFEKEGIVLQIITYQELEANVRHFERFAVLKGRTAVLDFEDRRSFWAKRVKKDTGYYSLIGEYRLFLDTFQKNRYNTLTK